MMFFVVVIITATEHSLSRRGPGMERSLIKRLNSLSISQRKRGTGKIRKGKVLRLHILPVEEIVRYVKNKRHHRVRDFRKPGNDERQG